MIDDDDGGGGIVVIMRGVVIGVIVVVDGGGGVGGIGVGGFDLYMIICIPGAIIGGMLFASFVRDLIFFRECLFFCLICYVSHYSIYSSTH